MYIVLTITSRGVNNICLYRVSGILFQTCEHKHTLTRNINI